MNAIAAVDPYAPTVVSDRRYRRSPVLTEALGYQCAHIQEGLSLEALVVSDDVGDRWVGSGDKSLCRLLSRSALDLSERGSVEAAYRLKTLQSLKSDLKSSDITTCRIKLPDSQRFVVVTGVGSNRLRTNGVVSASRGTKRILGLTKSRENRTSQDEFDAAQHLQELVDNSYARLVSTQGLYGQAPRQLLGLVDDGVYREAFKHILAPAMDAVTQSGVIVDDPWRSYRFRSRERRYTDGTFERTFRVALREARSGLRLGDLEIRFFHRHDEFEIPYCPRLSIRWR